MYMYCNSAIQNGRWETLYYAIVWAIQGGVPNHGGFAYTSIDSGTSASN